jgi:hypothetical protein
MAISSSLFMAVITIAVQLPRALEDGQIAEQAITYGSLNAITTLTQSLIDFDFAIKSATSSLSFRPLYKNEENSLQTNVFWYDSSLKSHTEAEYSIATNISDAENTVCEGFVRGDWSHPTIKTYSLAAGSLLPAGFPKDSYSISSLAVSSSTLAIGIASTTVATSSSLFLFSQTTQTSAPAYLSDIDLSSTTKYGIRALTFGDDYLYVATNQQADYDTCLNSSSCSQLQIISVFDAYNPHVVSTLKLAPTSEPFAAGSNGQSAGRSIAYANGFVYLGLTKSGSSLGDEFNIIDVHNPTKPYWIGGYHVGHGVTSVQIQNNVAYVTTDDTSREFMVIDIHDPVHPALISYYDAPGPISYGYGSHSIPLLSKDTASSSTVIFARSYTPSNPELYSLSVEGTQTRSLTSGIIGKSASPTSIRKILIKDFLLFVLTSNDLEFWNIANAEKFLPFAPSIPLTGNPTSIACHGNALYVDSTDNSQHTGRIQIITPQ